MRGTAAQRARRVAGHRVGGPATTLVVALVGFAATALLSFQLVDPKSELVALWLPNGVTVALFVLARRQLRLWVALGAVVGELIADTLHGYPWPAGVAFAFTDAAEAALAATITVVLIRRGRVRGVDSTFFAISAGAVVAPAIGGLVGAAISCAEWGGSYASTLLLWWIGDLTGIVLVVWLAVSLARPSPKITPLRRTIAVGEALLVVAVTLCTFGLTTRPLMFLVALPLSLVALRHSPRTTALACVAFAISVTMVTAAGHGPFTDFRDGLARILLAESFITVTTLGAFLIATTVSEERRALDLERDARSEAVAALAALEDADRLRKELISVVSHDLRTPLTSIMGYLELFRDESGALTPEGADYLDAIQRNADRLHAIMEDLLLISRSESGHLTLRRDLVDLRGLARDCIERVRPAADKKGLELLVEGDEHDSPLVHGDPHLLTDLLDNLLSNGIKYTDQGSVSVDVRERGGVALLSVTDTGAGISAADQAHLFERFFRAPSMESVPGTGLGLSIVKAIVDAHGGTIVVESAVGNGATFRVELPAETPVTLDGELAHSLVPA